MNNTNNEEQAGSASEVWRLRQFFGRSDERIGLRLLPTSSSAYHWARVSVCRQLGQADCVPLFIPCMPVGFVVSEVPFYRIFSLLKGHTSTVWVRPSLNILRLRLWRCTNKDCKNIFKLVSSVSPGLSIFPIHPAYKKFIVKRHMPQFLSSNNSTVT